MTSRDYIAVGSLIIAIAAFVYTYMTNTKKYELTSRFRSEILGWYSITVELLIRLRFEAEDDFKDSELKRDLLSKLSAQIEIGRFYFPNINHGDGYGENKPFAYKGYRNLTLDFLVYSYRIFENEEVLKHLKHAEFLQRHFTSHLFETLDPNTFLNEAKKHTNKTFSKPLIYEDFIKKDPDILFFT
jgi:hypothetical protein